MKVVYVEIFLLISAIKPAQVAGKNCFLPVIRTAD